MFLFNLIFFLMLDLIFRKKNCREFLKVYSEDLYRDIIPNVFEIGVLTLQNNYNKILFSKEELEEIILDIKNKENTPNLNIKPLQKLTGINQINNNNQREIQNKRKEERNERKFVQKKSNEVYPNWWWDLKDENEDRYENKNQIKKIQSNEIKNNINYENSNNQNMINRNINSNYSNNDFNESFSNQNMINRNINLNYMNNDFNQNFINQNMINRNINFNYSNNDFNQNIPNKNNNQNMVNKHFNSNNINNEFNQNVNKQNFYNNFNDENNFNDNKLKEDNNEEYKYEIENKEKPRKKMIMNILTKGNSNLKKSNSNNNYYENIQQKKNIFQTNSIEQEIINKNQKPIEQNSSNQFPKKGINYKIIFDKDLKPETIEKTETKNNYIHKNNNSNKETFNSNIKINNNKKKDNNYNFNDEFHYKMSVNQFYGDNNNQDDFNENEF